MATYKKKGTKPATKEERAKLAEENSTTAGVFNRLDEGASKTEAWVADHQNYIYIIVGVAAVVILGYLGYQRFIAGPTEKEAANEMALAQTYFNNALNETGTAKDSLYNLALNGGEGKYGFLDIIDSYSGTPSADLAHYYAGFSYLNTNNYQKAIDYLEDYDGDDEITAPLAVEGIGDAFMQLNQPEQALKYYDKAASMRSNSFTTPKALLKAAITALQLDKKDKAEEYLTRIKDEFADTPEAQKVPVYMGQAQAMK